MEIDRQNGNWQQIRWKLKIALYPGRGWKKLKNVEFERWTFGLRQLDIWKFESSKYTHDNTNAHIRKLYPQIGIPHREFKGFAMLLRGALHSEHGIREFAVGGIVFGRRAFGRPSFRARPRQHFQHPKKPYGFWRQRFKKLVLRGRGGVWRVYGEHETYQIKMTCNAIMMWTSYKDVTFRSNPSWARTSCSMQAGEQTVNAPEISGELS